MLPLFCKISLPLLVLPALVCATTFNDYTAWMDTVQAAGFQVTREPFDNNQITSGMSISTCNARTGACQGFYSNLSQGITGEAFTDTIGGPDAQYRETLFTLPNPTIALGFNLDVPATMVGAGSFTLTLFNNGTYVDSIYPAGGGSPFTGLTSGRYVGFWGEYNPADSFNQFELSVPGGINTYTIDSVAFDPVVPEPPMTALLGLGLLLVAYAAKRLRISRWHSLRCGQPISSTTRL